MKKIYQKKTGGEAAGGDQHALVRFVDLSMQTAVNLMYDCPLFYPLMDTDNGPQRQKLCVTISGDDRDALEIFKAVFWCGQMSKITLCINLVSKNVQKFREEITKECPQLLESCDPNSPILSIHPGMAEKDDQAEKNPPYAEVSFTEEMDDSLLRDTDYFIITSDDDAGAVSCEEEIRMRTESELSSKRQVIAVRIRNSDTAEVLKKTDPGTYETFVFPFGMTERVYSVRNVYMDEFTSDALQGDAMYNRRKQKAFLKDEYSYWANTARAVHAPYKAFMLGCLEDLDFNKTGTDRFVVKKERMDLTKDECDTAAFIEHRRWNAFMRTRGFSSFSGEQYHKWYDLTGTHKSLDLKLHNCLVESAESPVPLPEDLRMDDQIYDCLDKATYDACHVECLAENKEMTYEMLKERNYKRYDYPWVGGHLEAMLLKSGSDDDV